MRHSILQFAQLVFLFALFWTHAAPAQDILGRRVGQLPPSNPPVFALTGATVHVGNGEIVENATVVLREGLIEGVGQDLAVPPDAWTLQLDGMHIYPGLIDTLSGVGVSGRKGEGGSPPSRPPSAESRPGRGGERNPEGPGLFPHLSVADQIDLGRESFKSWRDAGVLTLNLAPDQGIVMGRSALVNLSEAEADRMIVQSPSAMRFSFEGLGFRTFPGSLMGVIAHIRQTLLDARHYGEVHQVYSTHRRGLQRPETDRALRALQPVVNRELIAIFPASREREIRRVLELAEELQIRVVPAGGVEAGRLIDALKSSATPVLISLNFPKPPKQRHPEAEDSLEEMEFRQQAKRSAADLARAGLPFAFYSDGLKNGDDFLKAVRTTVEEGLSKDSAIRALTLDAARIFGVDEQLGSIENGKIANLIVSEGELFDKESKIRHVFADGENFDITSEEESGESTKKENASIAPGSQEASGLRLQSSP